MQAHGRPDELYFLENVLYENQKLEFSDEDYFEMKNYVEEYLDDNGDVYANYFDHLCNTLGYKSPMDLNSCKRLFHNLIQHAQRSYPQ